MTIISATARTLIPQGVECFGSAVGYSFLYELKEHVYWLFLTNGDYLDQ